MIAAPAETVLEVRDLRVRFEQPNGTIVHAVTGAGYSLRAGETLAVVGESGSGKSVCAAAILGLLEHTARVEGSVLYRGRDLLALDDGELRKLRGNEISLVPQDAMAALNPLIPVADQIAELFILHQRLGRGEARERASELIERVGVTPAAQRARDLPHQFSGGMRQRLVIAMAVALEPDVLIADEATSALDVAIQLEILDMLDDLQVELGMSILLVTHDLLSVRDVADRVVVMYGGRVVEEGPVEAVFANPTHPYTEALLLSTPRLDGSVKQLRPIEGRPPGTNRVADACAFEPRCRYRRDRCALERPALREVAPQVSSACHFAPDFGADP